MEEDMNMQRPEHDFSGIEGALIDGIASGLFMESVRVKLFDIMESPVTPDQVSRHISLDKAMLQALLDFLEARELIVNSDGYYVNSPQTAEFLVSTSPFYQGGILDMQARLGESASASMRKQLQKHVKKHDETVSEGAVQEGGSGSGFLSGPAQFAVRGTLQDTVAFITGLDRFREAETMCDIGGNRGHYTTALLDRHPSLSAVIAEVPKLAAVIDKEFQYSGYRDRVSVLPFDLRLDALPERSYDLILASFVLHILADDLSGAVRKISDGLKSGGVFITQNLDPGSRYGRGEEKTVRELMTRALGYPTHYLDRGRLEEALRAAGFTDFTERRTGPEGSSYILAAVKE